MTVRCTSHFNQEPISESEVVSEVRGMLVSESEVFRLPFSEPVYGFVSVVSNNVLHESVQSADLWFERFENNYYQFFALKYATFIFSD